MLKKNIKLDNIKRVHDQITEEYPGDDVSPGIRMRKTGPFAGNKDLDNRPGKKKGKQLM